MYTVQIEHECGCFKKSEFAREKSFDTQKDAYNYSNIVAEFMNEEFCSKHHFFAQKAEDDQFFIRVVENPNAGSSCSSGSCNTGSCDMGNDATVGVYNLSDESCGTGSCGCS